MLLASYFFYAFAHWAHMFIMLFSTGITYGAGLALSRELPEARRKLIFWLALSLNLGLLFYFKYFTFFSHEVSSAFRLLKLGTDTFHKDILLPIGISFYIFDTTGYVIDVYRNRKAAMPHLGKYALFVSFFPQLIAGPIERARHLIPQFHFQFDFDYDRIRAGIVRWLGDI
jgi:D-alanyl-lipoteichoic acid acyltransferase DltB (MBOAT superfamily)